MKLLVFSRFPCPCQVYGTNPTLSYCVLITTPLPMSLTTHKFTRPLQRLYQCHWPHTSLPDHYKNISHSTKWGSLFVHWPPIQKVGGWMFESMSVSQWVKHRNCLIGPYPNLCLCHSGNFLMARSARHRSKFATNLMPIVLH